MSIESEITLWRTAAISLETGGEREAIIVGSILAITERIIRLGHGLAPGQWVRLVRGQIELSHLNPLVRRGVGVVTDVELDIWSNRIVVAYRELVQGESQL